jgi:glyoxylase-like metal-dependent hydrolase (beta-lactamase superfamily II)
VSKHPPPDLQIVSPHLAIWHAFDRSVKADLFSTALSTSQATFLIDPIPIDSVTLTQLQVRSPIAAIIVTNQNHWRAADPLAEQLNVPVFAHASAQLEKAAPSFISASANKKICDELEVIEIDGGAPGEIALFSESDGGTIIVGDALINFDPYGFTFLPAKYCVDHRQMQRSLQQLGSCHFERLFFSHGFPILSGASGRLQALLNFT